MIPHNYLHLVTWSLWYSVDYHLPFWHILTYQLPHFSLIASLLFQQDSLSSSFFCKGSPTQHYTHIHPPTQTNRGFYTRVIYELYTYCFVFPVQPGVLVVVSLIRCFICQPSSLSVVSPRFCLPATEEGEQNGTSAWPGEDLWLSGASFSLRELDNCLGDDCDCLHTHWPCGRDTTSDGDSLWPTFRLTLLHIRLVVPGVPAAAILPKAHISPYKDYKVAVGVTGIPVSLFLSSGIYREYRWTI